MKWLLSRIRPDQAAGGSFSGQNLSTALVNLFPLLSPTNMHGGMSCEKTSKTRQFFHLARKMLIGGRTFVTFAHHIQHDA
jgi:hypothetical protein